MGVKSFQMKKPNAGRHIGICTVAAFNALASRAMRFFRYKLAIAIANGSNSLYNWPSLDVLVRLRPYLDVPVRSRPYLDVPVRLRPYLEYALRLRPDLDVPVRLRP
ncbi:hypothetical protein BC829DRAFT_423735 [Chytridium lagenaria]|nr:hypothetical protein BC829DRAFT_423735 [Chytridium lagenaria]